jgi:hypothetical protein
MPRVISGSSNVSNGTVCRAIERVNTVNAFEYYALSESPIGPVVYKLDNLGFPSSWSFPFPSDEFLYANSDVRPFDMTLSSDNTRPDLGLHIVGTDMVTNPGANHFVESYFNGVVGCNTTYNIANVYFPSSTPVGFISPAAGPTFGNCPTFYVTNAPFGGSSAICGPFASVAAGSNAKPTGINSLKSGSNYKLSVRTEQNTTIISFDEASQNSILSINSIDGKTVASFAINAADVSYSFNNDFLSSGIYFATIRGNNLLQTSKFVITK